MRRDYILGKIIVCLVGIILMVIGCSQIRKRNKFLREGEEVTGEIVDYQKYMSNNWSYVYAFTLPSGRKIVGTDRVYHQDKQRRRKAIGEQIQLVYNCENPENFQRKSQWGVVIGFYVMAIMGIGYIALGLFVIH